MRSSTFFISSALVLSTLAGTVTISNTGIATFLC
jgi:hypothetical protein